MPDKRMTELPAAGALTGAELTHMVQGGANAQATVQAVADFTLADMQAGDVVGALTYTPADDAAAAHLAGAETFTGQKSFSLAPIISALAATGLVFASAGGALAADASNLAWDNTNKRLAVGKASAACALDVGGTGRATGKADPASGKGLEWFYNTTSDFAGITAIDRTGGAYKNLKLQANAIELQPAGSTIATATTTGIGIGRSTPDTKLEVVDATNSQIAFGTGPDLGALYADNTQVRLVWGMRLISGLGTARQTSASQLVVASDGYRWLHNTGLTVGVAFSATELMRLNATGLGIGTVDPRVKLDVAGSMRATGSNIPTGGAGVEIYYVPGANEGYVTSYDRTASTWKGLNLRASSVKFTASGTDMGAFTTTGLGVGTTGPASRLEVIDSSGNSQIRFGMSALRASLGGSDSTGVALSWGARQSGTTTFAAMLTSAAIYRQTSSTHYWTVDSGLTSGVDFVPTNLMTLNATGLGVGAAAGCKLDVAGTGRFTNQSTPSSGVGVEIRYDTSVGVGVITTYDRSTGATKPTTLGGTTVALAASGTTIATASTTGLDVTQPVKVVNANSQIEFGTAASQGFLLGHSAGTFVTYTLRYNGSQWVPSATTATVMRQDASSFVWFIPTGLTPGVAMTLPGSEKMTLNTIGLGIGVTPGCKLEVAGTARITGITSPTSGAGVETYWDGPNVRGAVFAYDRTAGMYRELRVGGSTIKFLTATGDRMIISDSQVLAQVPLRPGVYTLATKPAAASFLDAVIVISDTARGRRHAYSDGANWLYMSDDSIVA